MGHVPGTTIRSLIGGFVHTAGLDDPLWSVRDQMINHGIRHVVVEEQGRVVGIVSDRDVLAALSPVAAHPDVARESDLATLNKRVHQIMSHGVISAQPDMPIRDAVKLLLAHRISSLPVIDGSGRCLGIVTTTDIMIWALNPPAAAGETQAA